MYGNPNEIKFLEKVNAVIDLCIDRELYQYLDDGQILMFSDDAKKYLDYLQKNNGTETLNTSFGRFPVLEVKIPDDLINSRFKMFNQSLRLTNEKNQAILWDKWSNLFWAKRLRAEILKNNNKEWNERYDELILFLETHMPGDTLVSCKQSKQNKDHCITLLTFLMELSALDNREASYGYAERARRLLEKIHPDERKPYDRWIWWNMAMASQHMGGREQQAVVDFNRVISNFRDEVNSSEAPIENDDNFTLEFLLNIGPARIQRASIQLRLQLGYHALKTLSDNNFEDCLEKLKNDGAKLVQESAKHLINKKEMLKVEAFLQLAEMEQAKSSINTLCSKNIIFPELGDDWKEARLPDPKIVRKGIEIQLVEQIVYWYLEEAKELNHTKINEPSDFDKVNQDDIQRLSSRLASVENNYWNWVNGNRFDEHIYFSRWAQFLKIGAEIYQQLNELSKNNTTIPFDKLDIIIQSKEILMQSIKNLYNEHRNRLPNIEQPQRDETIKLEDFRSDDRPDFLNGLSGFYKNMSEILNEKDNKSKKLFDRLKQDHCKLLAAVDKNEKEFEQNTTISSLNRCNERLIWKGEDCKSRMACKACLKDPQNDISDYFAGLLECTTPILRKDSPDNELLAIDYESIMKVTEGHLLEHLQSPSFHEPKSSLHFVGLQRWNSLTPAQGRSVGGGYLIYHTNENGAIELGIAIDPGYDYVRNLFKMGFSLKDIDIILISHAHPDHLWDFESMVHLVHELHVKTKVTHCFNVILTLASYHRLKHIINNPELRKYINPILIDIDKEIEDDFLKMATYEFCFDKREAHNSSDPRWRCKIPTAKNQLANETSIEINCTRAYHDDNSDISDSFGFRIKFNGAYNPIEISKELWFGYTGDTKWVSDDLYNKGCPIHEELRSYCSKAPWKSVAPQYKDCDVLLIHLGSLIDHKNEEKNQFAYYETANKCESLIREKNHLYLMGIIRFLKLLHKVSNKSGQKRKLILMGEFGEELRGGIRKDLVRRLEGIVNNKWRIVPVDVGLDVLISDKGKESKKTDKNDCNFKFLCALCDNYCSMDYIQYFTFGQDEAIFHICRTCLKAFPEDVRKNKLKRLYEVGRELKQYPSCE